MDSRSEPVSRRGVLRRGLATAVGVDLVRRPAVAWAARPARLSKSAVQYTDTSIVEGKDCDDCAQWVPDHMPKSKGTCKIVAGEISPHGHCIAFTPNGKR